jgi:hypothetical protein
MNELDFVEKVATAGMVMQSARDQHKRPAHFASLSTVNLMRKRFQPPPT